MSYGRSARSPGIAVAAMSFLCGFSGKQVDAPAANYEDVAALAQLRERNVFGGEDRKSYILETTGNGVAIFDYDSDGWQDIFLVNGSRLENPPEGASNRLYRNNRDGTFSDVTERTGLKRTGWGQGVCVADYNGDGLSDLFVTYYGVNALYRNSPEGRFQEVTFEAGLPTKKTRWSTGCAFFDADRDGDLDLIVAEYVQFDRAKAPSAGGLCQWKGIPVMCGPRGLPGGTNVFYRNNGDGTFRDQSEAAGVTQPSGYYCFTPIVSDFDNDGWPDVYVACDSTPNILYHNRGNGTLEDVALTSGCAVNEDGKEQAGMGVTVGDVNSDGWLDIFVTNFSDDTFTLYRNVKDGTFTDVTNEVGLGFNTQFLGWGTGMIDFDHDGWKDIFAANGHVYPEVDAHAVGTTYRQQKLLYWSHRGARFTDVSLRAGKGISMPTAARGVAFGDLDNDGRLEIAISNMNDTPSLLVNRATLPHSLLIEVKGKGINRNAIGARVSVTVNGVTQTDEVRSGSSYISHNDFRLHFGLAAADSADRVEVRWPDGARQEFRNVPAGHIVTIEQGKSTLGSKPFGKPFRLWHAR